MTALIRLKKSDYSEYVVRSALYWIDGEYELKSDEDDWQIDLKSSDAGIRTTVECLLNDYRLREIIGEKAGNSADLARLVIRQISESEK